MYALMLRRVNSTVRWILYDSFPNVSAMMNSTLWLGNTYSVYTRHDQSRHVESELLIITNRYANHSKLSLSQFLN